MREIEAEAIINLHMIPQQDQRKFNLIINLNQLIQADNSYPE